MGWNGGFCGQCVHCHQGDYFTCQPKEITGITRDGGYAEYLVCKVSAVARVPEEPESTEEALHHALAA